MEPVFDKIGVVFHHESTKGRKVEMVRPLRRLMAACVLIGIAIALLAGCARHTATGGKAKLSFALCPKSLNNPYWTSVEDGMKDAAKKLGVEARFFAPMEADVAKQVQEIEGVVAKGKDGIAISPNDPASVRSVIARAMAKGIPTITFDADAPGSKRICYIGTDNFKAGQEAGRQMVKLLGGKGSVLIVTGGLGAMNLNQRIDGFRSIVRSSPGITIINVVPCDDDEAKAHQIIESSLRSRKDLAGIYAVGLWAANPAGKILFETGRAGKVKVVGFDTLDSELQWVKKGSIQALIGQRPYQMGYQSVEILFGLANGKKPEKTIIDTGIDVVTRENVESFLKK